MNNDVIITTKMYNKNKRQVYIWEENKDFYDKLPNKSKVINLMIRHYMETDGREVNQATVKTDSSHQE